MLLLPWCLGLLLNCRQRFQTVFTIFDQYFLSVPSSPHWAVPDMMLYAYFSKIFSHYSSSGQVWYLLSQIPADSRQSPKLDPFS